MNNRHRNRKPKEKRENYRKKALRKAGGKFSKLGMSRKWGLGLGTLGFAVLFPDTFGNVFETVSKPFTDIFGDLLGGLMPIIIVIIIIMILIAIIRR
tara:strand:- start:166 stop:456 length:291 start_codon:yes stop_codon:yes gene_type:complete